MPNQNGVFPYLISQRSSVDYGRQRLDNDGRIVNLDSVDIQNRDFRIVGPQLFAVFCFEGDQRVVAPSSPRARGSSQTGWAS
eukprot:1182937-Prorocentrum_minimum.AAC.4